MANAVPYGLPADIVTGDLRAAHRFADTVQAGVDFYTWTKSVYMGVD